MYTFNLLYCRTFLQALAKCEAKHWTHGSHVIVRSHILTHHFFLQIFSFTAFASFVCSPICWSITITINTRSMFELNACLAQECETLLCWACGIIGAANIGTFSDGRTQDDDGMRNTLWTTWTLSGRINTPITHTQTHILALLLFKCLLWHRYNLSVESVFCDMIKNSAKYCSFKSTDSMRMCGVGFA